MLFRSLEVLRELGPRGLLPPTVILTTFDDDQYVLAGLQAEMSKSGKDMGASKNPVQKLPKADVAAATAEVEVEVKKQATAG